MCCLVTDVCVEKSAELFEHSSVFNVIGTVDMTLNWYVCVFVCHGDLCSKSVVCAKSNQF